MRNKQARRNGDLRADLRESSFACGNLLCAPCNRPRYTGWYVGNNYQFLHDSIIPNETGKAAIVWEDYTAAEFLTDPQKGFAIRSLGMPGINSSYITFYNGGIPMELFSEYEMTWTMFYKVLVDPTVLPYGLCGLLNKRILGLSLWESYRTQNDLVGKVSHNGTESVELAISKAPVDYDAWEFIALVVGKDYFLMSDGLNYVDEGFAHGTQTMYYMRATAGASFDFDYHSDILVNDLRSWNRALTMREIADLYNHGRGTNTTMTRRTYKQKF